MRLFADKGLVPAGVPHAVALAPFWGAPTEDEQDPVQGRYRRYCAEGSSLFALTSFDEADAAILPVHWEHIEHNDAAVDAAQRLAARCAAVAKPLLVFYISDSVATVPLESAIVYRTSLLRSRHRPNERALPAFCEDIGSAYPTLASARPWRPSPCVSFCGFAPAPNGVRRLARKLRAELSSHRSGEGTARYAVCRALTDDERVVTRFLLRDQFWGGALLADGNVDWQRMRLVRHEYVENVFAGDYVLCARGGRELLVPVLRDPGCGPNPTIRRYRLCASARRRNRLALAHGVG